MDAAFKTHKETTFGWLQMVQEMLAARQTRVAARRGQREVGAMAPPVPAQRRYLTLR